MRQALQKILGNSIALILAGAFSFGATLAHAAPAQVILIRHGEKPPQGNELNARGEQRAQALVNYFETDPSVTQFGTPVAIYAMGQHGSDGSVRPIQTVTPLAQSLGLSIKERFKKNDIDALVAAIMSKPEYDGRMVLICWEHDVIPQIVQAFGYNDAPTSFGDVFDRTWILNFSGDQVVSFVDMPQELLPGDSAE